MKVSKSDTLKHEYHLRFDGLEEYRSIMWSIFCNDFFQKYIPLDSKILDVGAGYGEFIININAKEKYAMDLNPTMKELYRHKNIFFLNQDCTKTWNLQDESIDVVFSSNFLEHLDSKESVEHVLKESYRVLRVGG